MNRIAIFDFKTCSLRKNINFRKEWKKLSETNPGKEQSMLEFIRLLDAICPTFRTHVQEQTGMDKNASKKEHNNQ